ncbi:MAG: hypothetical protein WA705_11075 [Candidatus Ozemobacteraceae bacterium]
MKKTTAKKTTPNRNQADSTLRASARTTRRKTMKPLASKMTDTTTNETHDEVTTTTRVLEIN